MNPVIYSSLCAFLPPKVNCAIYSAWLVSACACIWSRVKCPLSVSFSRWIRLFTARCVHFLPPRVNCAICSPQLVYVCMCACIWFWVKCPISVSFSRWIAGESCYLQLAVCIFASQSELRHLQPTVSVCVYVCLHMILGQMPNFGKFFLVNRVIYSSLFVFYVSQSELRHLQCPVSVCVCACIPLYVCVWATFASKIWLHWVWRWQLHRQ